MATVDVSDLANQIARAVQDYTDEVKEGMETAIDDVTKEGVATLKTAGGFEDLSGDYRKGWTRKKVKGGYVIHNKTNYQLTHLLEKGHVIAGGGGRSRVFPHIRPVEEHVVAEVTRRIEEVIRG